LTRQDYLNECVVAYDYLRDTLGFDAIHAVGSSFGSYLSCLLSGQRNISSLALRVPANYFDAGFSDTPQYIQSDKLDEEKWAVEQPTSGTISLRALGHFNGKVLVVESGKDAIIRPETIAGYVQSVPEARLTHIVMKNAPHGITRDEAAMQEFQQILIDWFTAQQSD